MFFFCGKQKNKPVPLKVAVEMDNNDVPSYKELLARSKQ